MSMLYKRSYIWPERSSRLDSVDPESRFSWPEPSSVDGDGWWGCETSVWAVKVAKGLKSWLKNWTDIAAKNSEVDTTRDFFYLLRRKLELLSERTEFVVGQVDENWLWIRRTKMVAVKVCGKTWKRWSCCCFGFTHDSLSLSLSLPLSHPLTLLSTSKCLISHISSLSVHLLSNNAVASFLLFHHR